MSQYLATDLTFAQHFPSTHKGLLIGFHTSQFAPRICKSHPQVPIEIEKKDFSFDAKSTKYFR